MQDFSTDFHKHSLCIQRSAKLNSTDQKFIVQWIAEFSTAQASFVPIIIRNRVFSYLATHWRNGQNSMISQALHHTKHQKPPLIQVVLHTKTSTALSFSTDRTHHPPSPHELWLSSLQTELTILLSTRTLTFFSTPSPL
jgi:hypothetical protein